MYLILLAKETGMDLLSEYGLFSDEENALHKKVAAAIARAARDVYFESPDTANHAARYLWAVRLRQSSSNAITEAHSRMLMVLDNPVVAAAGNDATDNDVQFVVNSLIDQMANV